MVYQNKKLNVDNLQYFALYINKNILENEEISSFLNDLRKDYESRTEITI